MKSIKLTVSNANEKNLYDWLVKNYAKNNPKFKIKITREVSK